MKIVADLSEKHEINLKQIKRLGYILNEEVSTKPGQVTLAMDILQYLMWEFSEPDLIEIILKNKNNGREPELIEIILKNKDNERA